MLALFILVAALALGIASTWTFSGSGTFLREFARLIDAAPAQWGLEGGGFTRFVTGRYQDREVMLQLLHPGGDDNASRPGEIVLTMRTRARDGSPWKSSLVTFGNPELSRATFDLEGRYGLTLTLADGWLKASWTPGGWRFPGVFDERRWRTTLAQMHALAEWLEKNDEQKPRSDR